VAAFDIVEIRQRPRVELIVINSRMFNYRPETDRQSDGRVKAFRILHLKMDMRLAGVSRVAASADHAAAPHLISDLNRYALWHQMAQRAEFMLRMPNYDTVSSQVGGGRIGLSVSCYTAVGKFIINSDNNPVGRRKHLFAIAVIAGQIFFVARKALSVIVKDYKVVRGQDLGISLISLHFTCIHVPYNPARRLCRTIFAAMPQPHNF